MTEYPGVTPPDPSTPVGQYRLLAGDSASVALATPITGQGSYRYWSDVEITSLLAGASNSVPRAVGYGYMQLAAIYAMQGRSVKTDDLGLVTTQRSADLRTLARDYFLQADEADTRAALDIFDILPFNDTNHGPYDFSGFPDEGAPNHYLDDPANPGYLLP